MTCADCASVRLWIACESAGMRRLARVRLWFRARLELCWPCEVKRRGQMRIACRVALVVVVAAFVVAGPFALVSFIQWACGS